MSDLAKKLNHGFLKMLHHINYSDMQAHDNDDTFVCPTLELISKDITEIGKGFIEEELEAIEDEVKRELGWNPKTESAREFVDIKDMPDYNPVVKDNVDSVSTRRVYTKMLMFNTGEPVLFGTKKIIGFYPFCKVHGAMNKVSKEGLWRCLMCGVGCYERRVEETDG